jgi:adenylate cyclase
VSSIERKLLAILNGDVAGYSRLMAADEEATIAMLATSRDTIGAAVVANHGRLVDFTGDNFLAEFGSAVHALQCAVEIQRSIHAQNADIPQERRMNFRLGAHVGDVRIDGDQIFGDGVNIASRLESLSQIGGICLSRQMLDHVAGQIDLDYQDLGEHVLKNISDPVHSFGVSAASLTNDPSMQFTDSRGGLRGDGGGQGVPTIAVLPFVNLFTDPEHEYLVDGMTADIVMGLSCDKRFSVIAYNSVVQFKKNVPDIKRVGEILGVRYVVEGTVRQIGSQLRVSSALVDAETRGELWGGRVDRDLTDVLSVFDEVVEAVVTALAAHLRLAEGERYRRKPPEQLDAWALTARASSFAMNQMSLVEALSLVRRALQIEPEYGHAWAVYGFLTALRFPLGVSEDHQADTAESITATEKALTLDPRDPYSLTAHAVALQYAGRPGESIEYLHRSLRLNPSDVLTHCYYGRGLIFTGKPALALAHFVRFNRLNLNESGALIAGMYHTMALVFLQRWKEAEETARRALAASGGRNPWTWVMLMISLGAQGKSDEASAVVAKLKKVSPHLDRKFVEHFLIESQEHKEILSPALAILRSVWPGEGDANHKAGERLARSVGDLGLVTSENLRSSRNRQQHRVRPGRRAPALIGDIL